MPRNSIGSHKEQIRNVPFDIFTILTDIFFLQDSSIFESYTLPHLNTMGESQKLLSFVVNKRATQVRGGVTNYQISAFHTTYVGLLASGQALSYNTSLYFCFINYILILLIILAMTLVVQQALKGVAGPLGPDANVRLPVVKTNGSELASHHAIKMIQMFAFCLKMCSS